MITREHKAPDADITFVMIPFRTVKADMLIHALDKHISEDNRQAYHNIYLTIEASTADIRFGAADTLSLEWQGLQAYWQGRGRDVLANYDLFWNCVTSNVMWEWFQAYEATRDISIAAPPDVSEVASGTDPNPTSEGQPPSQTSTPAGKKLPTVAAQLGLVN